MRNSRFIPFQEGRSASQPPESAAEKILQCTAPTLPSTASHRQCSEASMHCPTPVLFSTAPALHSIAPSQSSTAHIAYNATPAMYQQNAPAMHQQRATAMHHQSPPAMYQQGSPAMHQHGSPAMHQQGSPAIHHQGVPEPYVPLILENISVENYSNTSACLTAALASRIGAQQTTNYFGHLQTAADSPLSESCSVPCSVTCSATCSAPGSAHFSSLSQTQDLLPNCLTLPRELN